MIYYVVSKHNDSVFMRYANKSINKIRSAIIEDTPELNSMSKKYNEGYRELNKAFKLDDDDVVCFMHEDFFFLKKGFEALVQKSFNETGADIIGVAGTKMYNGYGWWTFDRQKYGYCNVYQVGPNGQLYPNTTNVESLPAQVAVVDGCCIFVKNKVLKEIKWDETLQGFDHYDNVFCIDAYKKGFKTFVCNFDCVHLSAGSGSLQERYMATSVKLINKYRKEGTLPIIIE